MFVLHQIPRAFIPIPRIYVSMVFTFVFSFLVSSVFVLINCIPTVIPKLLPFAFGDEPSYLGESTTVQCSLSSGDLPVKFSWLLNGRSLEGVNGINVVALGKKTSVLSIDYLEENHAGNYTCLAKNKAGVSSYSSELIVKGTLKHSFTALSLFACMFR